MELYEFKVKQLVRLKMLASELPEKYPGREKRVRELVEMLLIKLDNLRLDRLYDYLRTITLYETEFPEFSRLMPTPKELEELFSARSG